MKAISYETYTRPEHKAWIIFIHGAGGSSKTFGRQIAAFRNHFNLLLPDLRDHGKSAKLPTTPYKELSLEMVAQDVLGLMTKLNINQAHFIGVSMGSIIIRIIEKLDPQKVCSIITGGGIVKLNFRTHILFNTGLMVSRFIPYQTLYTLVARILMPYENHKIARRLFIKEAANIQKDAFKFWLSLISGLKEQLDQLFNEPFGVPTLMIMGSQDFAFIKDSILYNQKFPFTRLSIIPQCGHICNMERPDEFNRQSLQFLLNQQ